MGLRLTDSPRGGRPKGGGGRLLPGPSGLRANDSLPSSTIEISPKRLRDLDVVGRVLVAGVDDGGQDGERVERSLLRVRGLVPHAVHVQPGQAVLGAVDRGHVELELDVALVPSGLELVDVLVPVHEARVVGAEDEPGPRASFLDRHRVLEVEDRAGSASRGPGLRHPRRSRWRRPTRRGRDRGS